MYLLLHVSVSSIINLPSENVFNRLQEYDATMMETYQLRADLQKARQELAHALYQHDASCRVIARLNRERDDALSKLENLKSQIESGKVAATAVATERAKVNGGELEMPEAKRVRFRRIQSVHLDV